VLYRSTCLLFVCEQGRSGKICRTREADSRGRKSFEELQDRTVGCRDATKLQPGFGLDTASSEATD
jgi:hypothetical protein